MNKKEDLCLGEMRLIGVGGGSFNAFPRGGISYTILCAVIMKLEKVEDVRLNHIEVDGFDATEKLLEMVKDDDADAIVLGGITFAGFNVIDPYVILDLLGLPVIIYSGKKPNNYKMIRALKTHFQDWKRRWLIIKNLGEVYERIIRKGEPPVFFEVIGESPAWAESVLRSSALICRIPEPVRVARLIARGVSRPTI